MGYRSCGTGWFRPKRGKLVAAEEFLHDEDVSIDDQNGKELTISFSDWKMSLSREFFEKLATLGDFDLEIRGAEWNDVWNLRSKKGKIETQGYEPTEWTPLGNELGAKE